jgi:hypothetical protein
MVDRVHAAAAVVLAPQYRIFFLNILIKFNSLDEIILYFFKYSITCISRNRTISK